MTTTYLPIIVETIDHFIARKFLEPAFRANFIEEVSKRLTDKLQKFSEIPPDIKIQKLIQQFCHDLEDIRLLEVRSEKLINKYQHYIKYHINDCMVHYLDQDAKANASRFYWLLENVNARLHEKLILGKLKFNAQSLFSVYFYRVIKNSVIDEIRKTPKEANITSEQIYNTYANRFPDFIKEEQNNLSLLLSLEFASKKPKQKFEFCVKVISRIILTEKDIKTAFPNCSKKHTQNLLLHFGKNFALMSKGVLWELLNDFVCQQTQSQHTIRTLKDWIKKHRNNLLRFMLKEYPIQIPENSTGPLERLLEEYFEQVVHIQYKE